MATILHASFLSIFFISQATPMPLLAALSNPSLDVLDMSYPFNNNTQYWPGDEAKGIKFLLKPRVKGEVDFGAGRMIYYESYFYSAGEHGGTHVDAPRHFNRNGWSTDEIPVTKIMGEAVKIDIREKCDADADYLMTVEDVEEHERIWGRIPDGAVVLVFTGWGRFYGDRSKYIGNGNYSEENKELHFPAVGAGGWIKNTDITSLFFLQTPQDSSSMNDASKPWESTPALLITKDHLDPTLTSF